MKRLALSCTVFVLGAIAPFSMSWAQTMTTQEAAQMMIKIRDTCKVYVSNGQQFWNGQIKRPEDAPGLVMLNKDIQRSVRRARNQSSAGEIAWQKCLDVVFNNSDSAKYLGK